MGIRPLHCRLLIRSARDSASAHVRERHFGMDRDSNDPRHDRLHESLLPKLETPLASGGFLDQPEIEDRAALSDDGWLLPIPLLHGS